MPLIIFMRDEARLLLRRTSIAEVSKAGHISPLTPFSAAFAADGFYAASATRMIAPYERYVSSLMLHTPCFIHG